MTRPGRESVEQIQIDPPDIERLDSKNFTLSYDEPADTMFIYFVSEDISPVSVVVDPDNDIYALVDPVSRKVVGVQLEAYLARLVYEWPEFLALGIWAGVSADRLERVTLEITEQMTKHEKHREARRRFFDLSIKEQIERSFDRLDDRGLVATA